MVKIKQIELHGFRGVLNDLTLDLNNRSALIYGDNASGKSSITDAVEWFLLDSVEHLPSAQETGSKQGQALRNVFLKETDSSSVKILFNTPILDSEKILSIIKNNVEAKQNNKTGEFKEYVASCERESLILRHKNLLDFISNSKKGKQDALFEILGYSGITKYYVILRKSLNATKKQAKNRGLDDLISTQKEKLITQLHTVIATEEQFLDTIRKLLTDIIFDESINSLDDISKLLPKLQKPANNDLVVEKILLTSLKDAMDSLIKRIPNINECYNTFRTAFAAFASEYEEVKQLLLGNLLENGLKVIDGEYKENTCPLCENDIDREQLIARLRDRIESLGTIRQKKKRYDDAKSDLSVSTTELLRLLTSELFKKDMNVELSQKVIAVATLYSATIKQMNTASAVELSADPLAAAVPELEVDSSKCIGLVAELNLRIELIDSLLASDKTSQIYIQIKLAFDAFTEMFKLQKERSQFERMVKTLKLITDEYKQMQKTIIQSFLDNFSDEIDGYYQFMNPDGKVGKIRLSTIENEDEELDGLRIDYDFLTLTSVSPPQSLLSESNLNCLGLAFFLTSVKSLNSKNAFIILDDVVSSFDTAHRIRFADLLIEQFGDYQLLVLTHEQIWYNHFSAIVKKKNWVVKTVKWTIEKGSFLTPSPEGLKQRIENKIVEHNEDNLGKDIREYVEMTGKSLAQGMEVRLPFRYNDTNEERMSYEILTGITSVINKQKLTPTGEFDAIERLIRSMSVGNKDSHDHLQKLTFDDTLALWKDVQDFEKLFYCISCKKAIAMKYYDQVGKIIRCECGSLFYNWKK